MEYSCCATMDQYDQVVQAGFDRIILPALQLAEMDETLFHSLRNKLENGPIPCRALNNFCGADLKLCGPGFNVSSIQKYSRPLMERCARLGVESISLGAPKSRNIPDGFPRERALDELKKSLSVICSEAAPFGVHILLEAVCTAECNFITYTGEALEIVNTMRLGNLNLIFDTYHAYMMGEDQEPLLRAMDKIRFVHAAQDLDNTRRCPQEGFIEGHRIYFDALQERRYDGEIGVEATLTGRKGELAEALQILKTLCGVTA